MPSVSLEPTAELLAAKQRELASWILRGPRGGTEPSAPADVSPPSAARVEEPAVPVRADTPQVADERPVRERLDASAQDTELHPPVPAALAQPSPGEPSGHEVRDTSGGAAQEPAAVASTRPRPGRLAGAVRAQPPAAPVGSPPGTVGSSNSTSNFPHGPAPVPPPAPRGAFSAGPGPSSSLLLGAVVAALMGLMLREAFRAPTGRAASPSARLLLAPFLSRPERPG